MGANGWLPKGRTTLETRAASPLPGLGNSQATGGPGEQRKYEGAQDDSSAERRQMGAQTGEDTGSRAPTPCRGGCSFLKERSHGTRVHTHKMSRKGTRRPPGTEAGVGTTHTSTEPFFKND